jgi:hypothetical protein
MMMMWISIELGNLLNIKISAKECLNYYELQQHKPRYDGYSKPAGERK